MENELDESACILAYHHVCNNWYPSIARVTTAAFKSQVNHIWQSDLGAATLSEFFLPGKKAGDRQTVLLTFDDALRCFYVNALPVLLDHNLRATVFVVSDFVGKDGGWDYYRSSKACRHMDWAQLRELVELGFEIGSHSCTHVDLKSARLAVAKNEIERSKKILEDTLGVPVNFFSYPFGRADRRLERLCMSAGYLGAVSMRPGMVNCNWYHLNRNAVYLFEKNGQFHAKIKSGKFSQMESIKLRAINSFSMGTIILNGINQKALDSWD